jgi:divalent metal cation (Fe/Co/Zn/Cd) transporter
MSVARVVWVRRGRRLAYATLGMVGLETVVALAAGWISGSAALLGFGVDSVIELTAALAALWRLAADLDPVWRERAEAATRRVIGGCFLALAVFVGADAVRMLALRVQPRQSVAGMAIAVLSLVSMPLLARAKREVALAMGSGALRADAQQTALCGYLSAILLGGLILNTTLGWWWADPIAALLMLPIIVREGLEGIRGQSSCGDACC